MTASAHLRARVLLRVFLMTFAAALVVWHVGSPWTWVLLSATGGLLMTVFVLPAVTPSLGAFFDRTETALLQAVTWGLLGLVFCLVFVPGRLFISLRPRKSDGLSPESYWWHPREGRSNRDSFDRQF